MDKSEIIKKVRQYAYTYVVEYKYYDENVTRVGYYCSDSYGDISENIEAYFDIDVNNGDEYKLIYQINNDFNSDDYLSDTIVWILKGECIIRDKEYAQYHTAYIHFIHNELWVNRGEESEYKTQILEAVLKYLDLRKQNPMTIYVSNEILDVFNISRNDNLNIRKRIELVLDPNVNGDILYKLAKKEYAKIVAHHLDKIGEAYNIHKEKSQYRVGVLFLKMFDALNKSHFLSPIVANEDGSIRNYTKYMKLMASYYGIDTPPTYREGVLKNYKEKGMKTPLYTTIRGEHIDVWLSFMK